MVGNRRPPAALVAFGVLLLVTGLLYVVLTPWHLSVGAAPVRVSDYFTPAQLAESEAYHDAAKWPAWLGLATSLALAVWIAFAGLGRGINAVVGRRIRPWPARMAVLTLVVMALQLVVALPFAVWSSLVARHYGLTTQDWAGWARDRLVGWVVAVVVTLAVLLVAFGMARRSPKHWWIPFSALAALAVFALSYIYPVVVEPMYNRFSSMPPTALRQDLLRYAAEDHLGISQVLVADASRRTSAYNAYVSGFGSTRRLVLYDTLLRGTPAPEIKVVVAHELGHAFNRDVLKGTVLGASAAATAVVGVYLLLGLPSWRSRVGARSSNDVALVPLVLALGVIGAFLLLPVANTFSRHLEARADLHALDLTKDPAAYLLVQKRLATDNLAHLTPSPVLSFWFDTHPTVMQRIAMGVAWSDEHPEEP